MYIGIRRSAIAKEALESVRESVATTTNVPTMYLSVLMYSSMKIS